MVHKLKFTREMHEDIQACTGFDVVAKLEDALAEELNKNMNKEILYNIGRSVKQNDWQTEKTYKRIFNELDPYGEENWEIN